MRILLADSDVSTLEIIQSFFEHDGHEAEIAANGLECVALLTDFAPDVLVLDCELLWGGSDGVLDVMRQSIWRSLPVILTGSDEVEAQHQPPVVDWLPKPFRLIDLLDRARATVAAATAARRTISTTFFQPCPVCGRLHQVSVSWLGKWVACSHCRATFQIRDSIHRVASRRSCPADMERNEFRSTAPIPAR